MPDTSQDDQTSPRPAGLLPEGSALSQLQPTDIAAAVLTLLWLAMAAIFFFTGEESEGGGPLSALVAGLAVAMPVALIWLIATSLRTVRGLREEAVRLQQEIDALTPGAELERVDIKAKSADVSVPLVALAWFPFTKDESGKLTPAWEGAQ